MIDRTKNTRTQNGNLELGTIDFNYVNSVPDLNLKAKTKHFVW